MMRIRLRTKKLVSILPQKKFFTVTQKFLTPSDTIQVMPN
jgi:hypothetical protein